MRAGASERNNVLQTFSRAGTPTSSPRGTFSTRIASIVPPGELFPCEHPPGKCFHAGTPPRSPGYALCLRLGPLSLEDKTPQNGLEIKTQTWKYAYSTYVPSWFMYETKSPAVPNTTRPPTTNEFLFFVHSYIELGDFEAQIFLLARRWCRDPVSF